MIPAVSLSQKSTQQNCKPVAISFQKAPTIGELNIVDRIEQTSYSNSFMESITKHISTRVIVALCIAGFFGWRILDGLAKAHGAS